MNRLTLVVFTIAFTACGSDPAAVTDATPSQQDDVVVVDAAADVASEDTDAEVPDSAPDVAVACEEGRVPRVVDGVVVDPCGCCAWDTNYCAGVASGGTPRAAGCTVVYDAAPPCVRGVDENGCETIDCSGSCLDMGDANP